MNKIKNNEQIVYNYIIATSGCFDKKEIANNALKALEYIIHTYDPLIEALESILAAWDSTCSIEGWDKDHLTSVAKARKVLASVKE